VGEKAKADGMLARFLECRYMYGWWDVLWRRLL